MRYFIVIAILLFPIASFSQEKLVRLYAPDALIETGLLKFALPRFSLKTQVRVQLVAEPDAADMVIGGEGTPLFEGAGAVWAVSFSETPHTKRLMDWMQSKVGQRTIFGFAPDGGAPMFAAPQVKEVAVAPVKIGSDAVLGKRLSREKCARCHAVDDATRKTSIGSTPSFFVLRTFADWEDRFTSFYVLKPHGAFTQIEDVTEPFPKDRPSPIVPIELTIEDLEAILAYMAVLTPADLGSPIRHQ